MSETSKPTALEDAEEQEAESQAMDMRASEQETGKVVRWYGQAGVDYREISVQDWRQAGVAIDEEAGTSNMAKETGRVVRTIRWHAGNEFAVPLSELDFLTEGQISQYIGGDNRFKIEDK